MGEDPSLIRSEIAATRERMDDTVDALEYKADVPARVNDRIETVKETISDAAGAVAAGAGAISERVGTALGEAHHAVSDAVAGVMPSRSATHEPQHTQPEDDIDVQED